ncbi:pentapeptide repeat-containing protein (plasmid) [Streptomyces globisporus]|uniref:pentapeptide repeat-containing protein n=1 Tax=Streptomyces globisporus TaxID=1908 RepID=UPI002F90860C|nr:pentapeptide repeat-containing protein [Streptomyces globisporus]
MIIPFRRRPKQDGRHTPNLWPVWLVAPGALLLVGLVAYGLYHGAELLLASESTGKGKKPVPVQDVIKTTVTVLTLAGAVLAALYAYRKQLLDEGASHRADATQLTERYSKAAEQLGHEQAAVRLAGVYAMARLADDWPEQRQVCVDVLCAYLRMPYETDNNAPGFRHGEREVRLTIVRIIRSHLLDPAEDTTWCGRSLDFTGTIFDDGTDFSGVTFSGGLVYFRKAAFSGGLVDFSGATFSGGRVDFSRATFSGGLVDFSEAAFSGGRVGFSGATLSGGQVNFSRATLSGGQVNFSLATFSDGQVDFSEARFSGGRVRFNWATFSGGRVDFVGATFSGGQVDFSRATHSGGRVDFVGATFSGGRVDFVGATLSGGRVNFSRATFCDGRINFRKAAFSGGQVDFSEATLSGGRVNFSEATLSGGQVDFRDSQVGAAANIDWGPFPPVPVNQP